MGCINAQQQHNTHSILTRLDRVQEAGPMPTCLPSALQWISASLTFLMEKQQDGAALQCQTRCLTKSSLSQNYKAILKSSGWHSSIFYSLSLSLSLFLPHADTVKTPKSGQIYYLFTYFSLWWHGPHCCGNTHAFLLTQVILNHPQCTSYKAS